MKRFRLVLAATAALALTACVRVNVPEGAFFYPNARLEAEEIVLPVGRPMPDGAETLSLAYDGGAVAATRVRGPEGSPVILFCGGNMFRRANGGGGRAEDLGAFGDVVMFDYPGYGDTPGTADLATFRKAGQAVADHAARIAREENRPLVAWGHSLGGPVCTEAAVHMGADALVLEATTPTARAAVNASLGLMRPFVRVTLAEGLASFDLIRSLDGYDGKVVVLEAGRDDTLPARLSHDIERGLAAEGVDVTRLVFPRANHLEISRQPDFRERVGAELATVRR